MKIILVVLVIVVAFLYITYANFYNHILSKNLPKPATQTYEVGQGPKQVKLVTLGDSLTAGVGVETKEQTYPYLLAQSLSQNGSTVEVVNLGSPGSGVWDVLRFQTETASLQKPDVVTILIGINDIHNRLGELSFKKAYQNIISELKKNSQTKIVLINIPYLASHKSISPPWNFILDLRTKQFNQIIKQLAADNGLLMIDLYSQSKVDFDKDDSLYSSDYFHPSGKGYILWGQIIDANFSR